MLKPIKISTENMYDAVHTCLSYDRNTGIFIWRINRSPNAMAGSIAGTTNSEGYRTINISGKRFYAHRLAWLYVYGEWPRGQIDHANNIKSDNRIANLRPCNNSQNAHNSKLQSNNTCGLKGVVWHPQSKKWRARLRVDGLNVELGLFSSKYDAHDAYMKKKIEMVGQFARAK